MVRSLHHEYIDSGVAYEKMAGLSTDDKPVAGLCTGSEFFEIDTGKTFYFDEDGAEGKEWVDPTATS